MALAEALPPDASTASTGLGLRYIGEHCMAYSGQIAYTQVETTALNFTTGDGYILARFGFSFAVDSSDDAYITVYFNDIKVIQHLSERGQNRDDWAYTDIRLIIPPFTIVKTTVRNGPSGSLDGFFSYLTGRVYGTV